MASIALSAMMMRCTSVSLASPTRHINNAFSPPLGKAGKAFVLYLIAGYAVVVLVKKAGIAASIGADAPGQPGACSERQERGLLPIRKQSKPQGRGKFLLHPARFCQFSGP